MISPSAHIKVLAVDDHAVLREGIAALATATVVLR
jgi:DNA-binding NarL/FixJ family response regulator